MKHHIYYQASGVFIFSPYPDMPINVTGYAGHGEGLNKPDMEDVHGVGPLHCGFYDIGTPVNNPETTGSFSLPLLAWKPLYGRSGFFIHGDNPQANKTASDGCIVLALGFRNEIWESGVRVLAVLHG